MAYAWMGRFAEALPAYQKAVEISPASDAWLSNLADDYRWLQRTKEANETYDKAIALAYKSLTVNPNDATTRVNLGTYYAKKGDFAQGLKFINEVLGEESRRPGLSSTTPPSRMRSRGTPTRHCRRWGRRSRPDIRRSSPRTIRI